MLKTITKFVVERRRLARQRRQQVIEGGDSGDPAGHSEDPQRDGDNSDSSGHSKVPPQLAETQLGEPPAPTVWGKLKWFNPGKRYGFVELSDGSGDAFLHGSVLAQSGLNAAQRTCTFSRVCTYVCPQGREGGNFSGTLPNALVFPVRQSATAPFARAP